MADSPNFSRIKGVGGVSHAEIVRGPEPALSVCRKQYRCSDRQDKATGGDDAQIDLTHAPKVRVRQLVFARSNPGCVSADRAILGWPQRIRRNRCIRLRARDSSLAAPPTGCLYLPPGCACWLSVSLCMGLPANLSAARFLQRLSRHIRFLAVQ